MNEIFAKFIECVDEEFFIDFEKLDELCNSLTEETKIQFLNLITLLQNVDLEFVWNVLNK